ncbi:MAG: hypothetical protein KDA33_17895, partial [Phycisphaerales bacterium]|nr:hypothetical protein [Phycisphaerales bacterium]
MHRGPAFVAFDLGASSGRAVLGAFDGHRLTMTEKHRFANDPVESSGGLRWNVRGMFDEMLTGLRACDADTAEIESVGIDTWGVDFALLDETGELIDDPYHYRDPRTRGAIQQIEARIPRETIYARTGTQFMEINSLCQLYA